MRRALYVLLAVTVVSCAVSVTATVYFSHSADDLIALIDEAAAALERDDFAQALVAADKLDELWSTQQHIWEVLTKHSEVDEATQALVRMRELCRLNKRDEALVECAWLKRQIQHIPHSESFRVENFL